MDLKNKHNFSKDELIDCSNGDLFGPGNGRLPNNEMLMMDRIVEINDSKGDYNIGEIQGELDITPELWFFDCHFSTDPVMPGVLDLTQCGNYWVFIFCGKEIAVLEEP